MRKALPPHGTVARYVWHYNVDKSKPCAACRAANKRHMGAWNRAITRLRKLHAEEFKAIYEEEKAA